MELRGYHLQYACLGAGAGETFPALPVPAFVLPLPLLTHSLVAVVVDFSHCHGTYHSFDVPKQSSFASMINVVFVLTIAYSSLSLRNN